MNYLKLNLAVLKENIPELYKSVLPSLDDKSVFKAKETHSGALTALYRGKLLHSAYDPVKEAEKTIQRTLDSDSSVCIIEGFGLGYYVSAALTHTEDTLVVVIDNSMERFLSACKLRDLRDIFLSERVIFLIGSREDTVSSVLRATSPGDIDIVRNRNLVNMEEEYFNAVENNLKRYIDRQKVNTATLNKFAHIWIRNLINNIKVLPEAGSIKSLEGIFGTLPVLLLAAGPSLSDLLPFIKLFQNRFVIVAVDTVMGALDETGITPDFLVVIDPQYWNARHLDRVDLSKTILVSESSSHPAVFRKGHKRLFFAASLFPLGQFMDSFTGGRRQLGAGGSVSTSAWDLAHILTKGPVYCCGLDLGYPDRETHYRGSFFEERSHQLSERFSPAETAAFHALTGAHPFSIENNSGGKTLTDSRLVIYKQWFEERLRQSPGRKTFSLSPKGIRINGFDFINAEKLLEFPVIRDLIDSILNNITPIPEEIQKPLNGKILEGLQILTQELNELSLTTQNSIDIIERYSEGSKGLPLSSVLITLDRNDNRIVQLQSKNITGFLIQSILQKSLTESNRDNSLEISKNLYRKIKEAAEYHLNLINMYTENR